MNTNQSQPENLEPENPVNLAHELRQMELATLRELPLGAQLDAETVSLREGFLALGHVLEAAAEPVAPVSVLPRVPSWSYSLAALGALAAALVVGAMAWHLWTPAATNITPSKTETAKENPTLPKTIMPSEKPMVIVQTPAVQVPPVNAPEKIPAPEVVTTDTASELAWDDSLDNAISAAGERLWTIRHNSFRGDGVYTSFSGSLEKIGQEIDDGSL